MKKYKNKIKVKKKRVKNFHINVKSVSGDNLDVHGKFQKVNHKTLLDEHKHSFLSPLNGLLCVKFHGKSDWFNQFKYFEKHKSYAN